MALIKWNDSFSVNVKEIDLQHQKLVEMINSLADAMKARKTKEIMAETIKGLIDYTVTHFSTEEKYFDQFSYPQSASHKKEHADFIKQVNDFKNGFDEGRMTVSMQIIDFLQNWLITHIKGSDKKYSSFFNNSGLQ